MYWRVIAQGSFAVNLKPFFIALALLCATLVVVAQQPKVEICEQAPPVWISKWDDIVDKRVVAEGLAWGHFSKGIGPWAVLGNGERIYISGIDYGEHDLNGHLVRFAGTLRKRHMTPAPSGSQGYGKHFDYYELEKCTFERIEKADKPWVRLERNAIRHEDRKTPPSTFLHTR